MNAAFADGLHAPLEQPRESTNPSPPATPLNPLAALLPALIAVTVLTPLSFAAAPDVRLLDATLVSVDADHAVFLVDVGTDGVVVPAARVVWLNGGEVLAAGEAALIRGRHVGVRARFIHHANLVPGASVVVVRPSIDRATRLRLAPQAHAVAAVDSVLPGDRRLWIDAGADRGWQVGEHVLVRRGFAVLGWGVTADVAEETALVTLSATPLEQTARQTGDVVEAMGCVGNAGTSRSRVVASVPSPAPGGPTTIALAGNNEAFAIGDRFDLRRGGVYVGFAQLVAEEPVLAAECLGAFQRLMPAEGDVAVKRPRPDDASTRTGYVFRLEGEYALITLGEADGVRKGQTLMARVGENDFVRLSVRALYPDHCGAELVDVPTSIEAALPLWTAVSTIPNSAADGETQLLRPLQVTRLPHATWLYDVRPPKGAIWTRGAFVELVEAAVGVLIAVDDRRGIAVRIDGIRYD